ncbi:MAG: phosphoadenylyl-sulfate reductase [Bradymonadia bacterium]
MFAEQFNVQGDEGSSVTDPRYLLEWATEQFEGSIALATSLGNQTLVIIDMLYRMNRRIPVFCLDTGLLFDETYELWREVEQKYELKIEGLRSPLTLSDQSTLFGDSLWNTQPDECCKLRKVLPLRQRIQGLGAWVTGLRRTPGSPTRDHVRGVEWDAVNGLFKVNPLWAWSPDDVVTYMQANQVPSNALLTQGYRSIGCAPCTSPCTGGDERSGRWSGQSKTECGLHFMNSKK